jgi:nicotinamidase/pyrazinamidase
MKVWPAHCIQNTQGAELHPNLKVPKSEKKPVIIVKKGANSDIDSYSAFFDNCKLSETNLNKELKSLNITDLYVCGLAGDVCVGISSGFFFLLFFYKTLTESFTDSCLLHFL